VQKKNCEKYWKDIKMNFENLKENLKKIKAPEISFEGGNSKNDFIELLKKQDAKDKSFSKKTLIAIYIYIVISFILFVVNPDPDLKTYQRIGGGLLFTATLLFGIIIREKILKSKFTDYNGTTLKFFEEAERRFRWQPPNLGLLITGLILIDAGECILVLNRYWVPEQGVVLGVIILNLIYLGLLGVGFFIGYIYWKKNKAPLLKKIQTLKSSFYETENGNK
jgi:hypothetical protein